MENKDKKYKGKKEYRGMTKFEYQILWTLLWFVFIGFLSYVFTSMAPLWLLIFWLMGSKW